MSLTPAGVERSARKKLLSDGVVSTLIALLVKLRGLILLPIISRAASITDYGVWVQVTIVIGLVPPFFGLNAHQALTRFVAGQSPARAFAIYERLVYFAVPLATATGSAACAAVYFLLADDDGARTIAWLCALLIPAIALNKLSIAYVRGRGDVKLAYSLDAALNVLSFLGSATVFALGLGVVGGVAALVAVYGAFSLGVALRHFWRRPRERAADGTPLSAYLLYSLPTIPAALADWVLFGIDRYVIAYFVDNTAVGLYAACYSLATTLLLFSVPVEYALMPLISEQLERGERSSAMRLTKDALAYVGIPSLLGAVLLVKDGPWLLHALTGAASEGQARSLLTFVAPGLFLWSLTRVLFQVHLGAKRTVDMATTLLAAALVNLACNLVLVPRIGSVGAAIATTLAYACTLSITLVRLRADLALAPSSIRGWSLLGALAAPCVAAVLLPPADSWPLVILDGVTCTGALLGALLVMRVVPLSALYALRRGARTKVPNPGSSS